MMMFGILYLLFAVNLITVISEKQTFYKDVRFWLMILSLFILISLTFHGYAG